ncbi:hypothetical protein ASG17_13925 [Brevundimonas sp. Leaf363]|uniref:DUF2336 domain-containing protein n=1 Tax=Brevundimonas sp. Leaf363 TaxID=1736353 RepID=UPI0006FAA87D|nr:DUF2336 domain-containing protein [Brevundimonas sp. Leaf363]KQS54038.1 hypothetical protein ASG17_13925 [Brevundimonas sp. Leaf363]
MSGTIPSTGAAAVPGSRLHELVDLAREPSSERRRVLLRELTDHFFGSTPEAATRDLYGDVLGDLARDMETAVRAEIAARFADSPTAPHNLIRQLAHDEAAVAGPVLAASPVLTDADLIGVANAKGQEHLAAMSGRTSVSEALADAIIARADDQTLGTLLANDGARLSRGASETVVRRAQANPALHQPTVARKAMPADLLNEMYFVVEARLRQQILEQNASMDPALVESALAAGRDKVALEDGALPSDYSESLAYVQELRAAGQLTPQMLARMLRSNGRTAFVIALGQLADVDFHIAHQVIERREIDALAVICKAADLDRALFLTYAVVLLGSGQDAMTHAHGYASLYQSLTRDAAGRTVRFWRMRRTAAAA